MNKLDKHIRQYVNSCLSNVIINTKNLREEMKWSQEYLSIVSGVLYAKINKIEECLILHNKQSVLSMEDITMLSDAFNVDILYFLRKEIKVKKNEEASNEVD